MTAYDEDRVIAQNSAMRQREISDHFGKVAAMAEVQQVDLDIALLDIHLVTRMGQRHSLARDVCWPAAATATAGYILEAPVETVLFAQEL
jgi:hypothetical protein